MAANPFPTRSLPAALVAAAALAPLASMAAAPPAGQAPSPAPAATATAPAAPPFSLTDPARIAAGQARFGGTCAAYCHGSEGVGGRAPSFKGRGSDFVPAAAFQTITEGRRGADIMPPWGKAFTPEQIWELVAYLNWLAGQPAPP